jgi:nucleoside-diphosphate-sugar epimerase
VKKLLITGATGFIGRHLVATVLEQGHSPRLLVRDPQKVERLFQTEFDVVQGDLQDQDAMRRAMDGVDTVLHLAALATAHSPDPDMYMRDNAKAVGMLLDEAAKAGVRRFVHVSSILALPPTRPANQWGVPHRPTPYAVSKVASEDLVFEYAAAGHEAVVVRPTRVYGPGPWNDANGTTSLMAMYLQGQFRFRLADGGVQANYVYVQDVVQGILLAAEHGKSGEGYQLGGEDASLVEFFNIISEVSGIRRRVFSVPVLAVAPVAYLCAGWGKLGGSTSLTPEWLNNFLEHRPVDISRTRDDLGYNPLMLRDGVAQTLNWLMTSPGGEPHGHQSKIRRREDWS